MKPTTDKRARWVQCPLSLTGACIAVPLCAAGLYIDIGNNYAIGASYLTKLGEVMALAAIVFAGAPTIAAIVGRWGIVTISCTAFAAVLTIAAAYLSYTSSLAAKIEAVAEMQRRTATARDKRERATRDLAAAEAEAARIEERRPSARLIEMSRAASDRARAEGSKERGGCGKACREAEAAASEYLRLSGLAEAREAAERRAAEARAILASVEAVADAEPQQNLAAVDTAMMFSISGEQAAKWIARFLAFVAIALTVGLGLLAHAATSLTMAAFGIVPLTHRHKPASAVAAPQPKAAKPSPKGGRKPMTAKERIAQWAGEELEAGAGETGATRMLEAFEAWKAKRCPDLGAVSPYALAQGLKAAGVEGRKVGGKVRYRAKIKGDTAPTPPAKRARKAKKSAPATDAIEPRPGRLH
jgi:hypothetical protein